MHSELALADLRPAEFHHPRAVVEPHHLRPAAGQFGGVKTQAARRVKDPLARHISQQRQAGRPVVAGVEEPVPGVVEKLVGGSYSASVSGLAFGVWAGLAGLRVAELIGLRDRIGAGYVAARRDGLLTGGPGW